MAKKRFSYDQYTDALTQARENRDAEWLEEHDALHAKLEAEEIDIDTYWEWMGENPRPSETVLQKVHSRKLMKKKSKKNIQKKIVIVDEEALREVLALIKSALCKCTRTNAQLIFVESPNKKSHQALLGGMNTKSFEYAVAGPLYRPVTTAFLEG